ncbi:hypothetical protein [Sinorhizobium americanum]|uniref:hypothetical protein n=1 Tax=Sinorhizobium americanum TaxID=194963 RepID=UPI0014051CC2|nr:hypothetical protein [Sinorhizobium americanum]
MAALRPQTALAGARAGSTSEQPYQSIAKATIINPKMPTAMFVFVVLSIVASSGPADRAVPLACVPLFTYEARLPLGCDQLPVIHLTCSCGRKSLSTIRGMSFLVMPMSSSSLSSRL